MTYTDMPARRPPTPARFRTCTCTCLRACTSAYTHMAYTTMLPRRPAAPKRALSYPLATRSTSASWWLMAVHSCAALSLKPNIASELSSGALSVHTRRVCVRTCVMHVCVCGWMDVYIHDICYVMYTPRYRGQIGSDRRASRPSGGLPAPATAPASAHSCHHRLQRERTPSSLDRLLYMKRERER